MFEGWFENWWFPLISWLIVFLSIINQRFRLATLWILWRIKWIIIRIIKTIGRKFIEILITSKIAALLIFLFVFMFISFLKSGTDAETVSEGWTQYFDFYTGELVSDFINWILTNTIDGIKYLLTALFNFSWNLFMLLFLGKNW